MGIFEREYLRDKVSEIVQIERKTKFPPYFLLQTSLHKKSHTMVALLKQVPVPLIHEDKIPKANGKKEAPDGREN